MLTEDDDKFDSDAADTSTPHPARKNVSLGQLSEKFSTTLAEPTEQKVGGEGIEEVDDDSIANIITAPKLSKPGTKVWVRIVPDPPAADDVFQQDKQEKQKHDNKSHESKKSGKDFRRQQTVPPTSSEAGHNLTRQLSLDSKFYRVRYNPTLWFVGWKFGENLHYCEYCWFNNLLNDLSLNCLVILFVKGK